MSIIIGILLTVVAAIAGTILCPPPATRHHPPARVPDNRVLTLALATCLAIAGKPALAGEPATGHVSLINGTTLTIDGGSVTLFGIVMPAPDATCWDAHEVPYACGRQVREKMIARIGTAEPICERHDRPDSGSAEATCRIGDEDLGDWMIANGYAMPARDAPASYRRASDRAWGRRAGLWAGVFDDPTD
ncbi:thermonuclease family protein [Methylobacterium sp. J-092]|uniref:thermonuclease family protein n=1 Tax=Methylobacterium sp. J-092 TaxID=2836667 RepID=UPI001FBA2F0D|nr:thermonuclease family protein [Methylobacterium sp. J-092]MCJ2006014.1 thermonuclease family protein [Methylobacterium sp. J-092]